MKSNKIRANPEGSWPVRPPTVRPRTFLLGSIITALIFAAVIGFNSFIFPMALATVPGDGTVELVSEEPVLEEGEEVPIMFPTDHLGSPVSKKQAIKLAEESWGQKFDTFKNTTGVLQQPGSATEGMEAKYIAKAAPTIEPLWYVEATLTDADGYCFLWIGAETGSFYTIAPQRLSDPDGGEPYFKRFLVNITWGVENWIYTDLETGESYTIEEFQKIAYDFFY